MKRIHLSATTLVVLFYVGPAFADAPAAAWSPGPLWLAIQPYLLVVFGVIFSALFAWACALFQKHTGIVISQNARDQVQTAALNAAGRIMASQDQRFATMKVDINSPLIAEEIPVVTTAVKNAVDQIGMTPDRVGALIQGKLGQLQAQAQSVPPSVLEAKP